MQQVLRTYVGLYVLSCIQGTVGIIALIRFISKEQDLFSNYSDKDSRLPEHIRSFYISLLCISLLCYNKMICF